MPASAIVWSSTWRHQPVKEGMTMEPGRSGAENFVFVSRRGLVAAGAAALPSVLGACARPGRPGGAGESREQAAVQLRPAELLLAIRGGQVDTPLWQEVAQDFNARYAEKKISVRVDEHPSSGFDQKMATLAAGNLLPDLMQFSDEPFFYWASRGMFMQLDRFVERDRRQLNVDDFIPGVLDFWRWDETTKVPGKGKLYGMPRAALTDLIVYNRRVFREAGVPEPPGDGNWTWDQFLEISRRLVKLDAGGVMERAAILMPNFRRSLLWLPAYGAPGLADTVKRVSTLNHPVTIQVFKLIQDYRHRYRIAPFASEFRGQNAYRLLADGRTAMMIDAGYLYNIRDAFKDAPDNWEVAHVPKGPRGAATRGAWSPFAMGSQTRNPDAAWEFMKYATGVEGQSTLIRLGYLMSVRKSVNEKVYVDPRTPQHEERWLQATAYQHFEPLCEVYPQMQQVHNYYWDQMMSEEFKREPAEVVKLMDETINQLFQTGDLPANWQR
jgi:multiple sugar transport system substrate-binding protein